VRILSCGKTDVGRVRTNNEDSFHIVDALNLFALSDGMGGEAHGEIASALAIDTVVNHFQDAETNPAAPVFGETKAGWNDTTKRLFSAVYLANKKIFESAEEHPEQKGMGATLTVACIEGERLSIAHVGDSRAYLLRGGNLQQLTSDHSLVAEQVRRGIITPAEAERSSMQSVLLRALGSQAKIEIDAEEQPLFPGDLLLLCSDGLTRMVAEPEIVRVLKSEEPLEHLADALIALANKKGGADNITVIVARFESAYRGWFSWLRRGARKHAAGNGSAGGK
jgi:protein phosphatase